MADGTLIFDTKIDNSGIKKSLQDIKKQVNSMGNTVREFQLVIAPTIKAKIEKDAIKQAVQATNEQLKNAYAASGLSMNMTPKLDLSKIEPNIQKLIEMLTPLKDYNNLGYHLYPIATEEKEYTVKFKPWLPANGTADLKSRQLHFTYTGNITIPTEL